jgi:hypothetical protein
VRGGVLTPVRLVRRISPQHHSPLRARSCTWHKHPRVTSTPLIRIIGAVSSPLVLNMLFLFQYTNTQEPCSSGSIVSGYGLSDRGSIPGRGERIFLQACVQTGSGDHPASCTMGAGGPFPGAKAWLGRDADHSALDGGEWSGSRLARALFPGKAPPAPIVQEAGWSPEPVWTQRLQEKSFLLCRGSNLDRPFVQPVPRHYTD